MSNKFIVVVKDGKVRTCKLSKPQAPRTIGAWKRAAAEKASLMRVPYFLFRYNGCWHGMSTVTKERIRTFPAANRDAAEMWLLHRMSRPDTGRN